MIFQAWKLVPGLGQIHSIVVVTLRCGMDLHGMVAYAFDTADHLLLNLKVHIRDFVGRNRLDVHRHRSCCLAEVSAWTGREVSRGLTVFNRWDLEPDPVNKLFTHIDRLFAFPAHVRSARATGILALSLHFDEVHKPVACFVGGKSALPHSTLYIEVLVDFRTIRRDCV